MKSIELLVKIIFALSMDREILSIEKGKKRTSGLTLGNENFYYLRNWTEKSTVYREELLVKIIFALSITTSTVYRESKKRTSGLTLGNERGEKN